MKPYYEKDNITLYCGDNQEVLPTLPEASVDFVCSDPPYGLGFMGRSGTTEFPASRIGRPSSPLQAWGIAVAFGGTRAYHRLTCAIEEPAGKSAIAHVALWPGFPKAARIGKMIDKATGPTART